MVDAPAKLAVEGLAIRYGDSVVLSHVDLEVREHEIFGIIGPANAGKTSFLKALNRMPVKKRLAARYEKFREHGQFEEEPLAKAAP